MKKNLMNRTFAAGDMGVPRAAGFFSRSALSSGPLLTVIICLLLVLATVATFWPVRHCEFVNFDDPAYVTENDHVRAGLTWEGFLWAFRGRVSAQWQPVTLLSHMLDCQLYGLNASRHHLMNLLFHVLNVLLFFLVFRRMTGAVWRSALVAALFGLHPLRVESVAWVAERKDVLSTLFFLLTLGAYVRYVEALNRKSVPSVNVGKNLTVRRFSGSTINYSLALLFFALGLMSKPMLVTLPFVLLLLDYWPLRRCSLSPVNQLLVTVRPLLLEKMPFFLLSVASSAIAYQAQQSGGALTPFPAKLRLENALIAYCRYLSKTIWPADLAVLYPHPGTWPQWQVISAGLFLAVVSVLAWYLRRRHPSVLTGWLWFLGALVPVIGFVQPGGQSMADRFTYVPLTGIFIMALWSLGTACTRWRVPDLVTGAVAALLLFSLCVRTRDQLRTWRDSISLWTHALACTSRNWVAHYNLGMALANQGKWAEAIQHYNLALVIVPQEPDVYYCLGNALFAQERVNEAIECYERALQLQPDYADVHHNLAIALIAQEKWAEAIQHDRRAVQLKPDHVEACNNLGVALFKQGKWDEAVGYLERVLQLRPDYGDAHFNLGKALIAQGRLKEGIQHYKRALELKPNDAETRVSLGKALIAQGKWAEAVEHYERGLQLNALDGDKFRALDVEAHNNFGLALAGEGKFSEAIQHYERALELNPKAPETHDNMGIALAAQGKLAEAIGHFQAALRDAPRLVGVHQNLGLALAQQGRLDEAAEQFREAIRLDPGLAEAHNELALIHVRRNRFAEAETEFQRALDKGAEPAGAHYHLGQTCAEQGKAAAALGHFREALRLRPDWVLALNDLAWLLATRANARQRDGGEAVRLAERAVALTQRRDARMLDTLGTAYAEAGRYAEAEATGREAMALAKAAGQTALAGRIETRCQGYAQQQPWRER
jgi:protein O-mannosyl-transferase